jgi:hypothetical protein
MARRKFMKGQSFPHSAFFPIIELSIHKKNNVSEKGKFEFSRFNFFCGFYGFLVD